MFLSGCLHGEASSRKVCRAKFRVQMMEPSLAAMTLLAYKETTSPGADLVRAAEMY